MAVHGMPQRWRGHPLRTIREVYCRPEHGHTARFAVLDCGHVVNVSGHTNNKVGDRTKCPLCR